MRRHVFHILADRQAKEQAKRVVQLNKQKDEYNRQLEANINNPNLKPIESVGKDYGMGITCSECGNLGRHKKTCSLRW